MRTKAVNGGYESPTALIRDPLKPLRNFTHLHGDRKHQEAVFRIQSQARYALCGD
jgi:hypothetical protein